MCYIFHKKILNGIKEGQDTMGWYKIIKKKLNDTLGDIDMTKDQEKTLVWLAGNDTRTIDNIIKVIEKLKQD